MTQDNTTKNAYELIRDANKVAASASSMYDQTRAGVTIKVQETKDQPLGISPTLYIEVKADTRQVMIETDDDKVNIPLAEFWQIMQDLVVLKRVQKGSKQSLDNAKQSIETYEALHCEALEANARKLVKKFGGEWDLPSIVGQDEITFGLPEIKALPKTIYIDGNDRLNVACEDENGNRYTPQVKYPYLRTLALLKLIELLERPIDEVWNDDKE